MVDQALELEAFEPAITLKFWLLAAFIIAFWLYSAGGHSHPPPTEPLPTRRVPITFTIPIQPFLTSLPRRLSFIAVYISILFLQLMEGRWVLQTTFLFAGMFFEGFPGYGEVPSWVFVVYCVDAALVGCFVVFVVGFGLVIVVTQVLAIFELTGSRYLIRREQPENFSKSG